MPKTEIIVAKTAGFCFGVSRAVSMCDELLDSGRAIATLGPIIHNDVVVARLAARGAREVDDPVDAGNDILVIRSHGVGRSIYETCRQRNIAVADATCPFVAKIHRIVAEAGGQDDVVFIAGDGSHPEVQGIIGHCSARYIVFDSYEQLKAINPASFIKNNIIMVAQTTFNLLQYEKCVEYASQAFCSITCCNTICAATRDRQEEARGLAARCSAVVVIGGRHSSNTKKLFSVCKSLNPRTHLVECAADLTAEMISGASLVGVTAGASAPQSIIEEVLTKMSEIIKENNTASENENEELNFAEAVENYLRRASRNQRYVGVVTSVMPSEVIVDIGTKQTGVVPADEMTSEPGVKLENIVKKGDKLNLVVIKVNDQEGIVTLSKKRLDSEAGYTAVQEACESGEPVEGTVTEKVNAGVVATVNGVRVFIHDTQTGLSKDEDAEVLVGKKVRLKITEAKNPRSVRGSIRRLKSEERMAKRADFWAEVEPGKKYHGTVKSITPYGVFVDLGGVDGMIHISELSWGHIKHPSEVAKVGDEIDVYVKNADKETHKISLGYKTEQDNPWNQLREAQPGTIFEGPVVSMVKYGAFVRIMPDLDGFVHISQISNQRIEKPQDVLEMGQMVKARLMDVDFERKRISLSLRDESEPREQVKRELTAEEIEAREIDEAVARINAD